MRSFIRPRATMAFTRLELVVVIAVIALLLALVLVISNSRESARRTQCTDHIRQLALAMTNFESAHGAFPTAVTSWSLPTGPWPDLLVSVGMEYQGKVTVGPNWASQLLGQMEETSMHQSLVRCVETQWNAADDCERPPWQVGGFWVDPTQPKLGRQTIPQWMRCPSAPIPRHAYDDPKGTALENLAKANYTACLGSGMYIDSIDGSESIDEHLRSLDPPSAESSSSTTTSRLLRRGAITIYVQRDPRPFPHWKDPGLWQVGYGKGVQQKRITDGTAKTMIVSEVLTVDGNGAAPLTSTDIRGCWVSASMGASTYSHLTPPNSTQPDVINGCELDVRDLPRFGNLACRQQPAVGKQAGDTYAAARSHHVRGVVAARADGSVGFYTDDIDPQLWQALGTRAGGD